MKYAFFFCFFIKKEIAAVKIRQSLIGDIKGNLLFI